MIAQPDGQDVGVGNRRLAQAKAHADFGAQPLGSSNRKECFTINRRGYAELFSQNGNTLCSDFGFVALELTSPASGPGDLCVFSKL
jgi:hypothetical protein